MQAGLTARTEQSVKAAREKTEWYILKVNLNDKQLLQQWFRGCQSYSPPTVGPFKPQGPSPQGPSPQGPSPQGPSPEAYS